jgi:hypothetical protein
LLLGDVWYRDLTAMIGWINKQTNFVNELGSACPHVATTRWLSMSIVTKWILDKKDRIYEFLKDKEPVIQPDDLFWVMLHVVDAIAQRAAITFKQLQGGLLLVSQQRAHLRSFQADLMEMFGIESLADVGWVDDDNDEVVETRLKSPNDLYGVTLEGVLDCVGNDFAMFVSDLWEPLTLQIRREFSESVGQSLLKLVEDMDESRDHGRA